MKQIAEQIVDALLEGHTIDWFLDRWDSIKHATGIGHDEFGMGKPEKGFKPKYRTQIGSYRQNKKTTVRQPPESGEKTWDVG